MYILQLTLTLRFADDQAMVAGKKDDLKRMMDRLNKTTTEYGMKTNTKKTKVMKINRVEGEKKNLKITIDEEEIEQVTEFYYLGSLISSNANATQKSRKGQQWDKKRLLKERSY